MCSIDNHSKVCDEVDSPDAPEVQRCSLKLPLHLVMTPLKHTQPQTTAVSYHLLARLSAWLYCRFRRASTTPFWIYIPESSTQLGKEYWFPECGESLIRNIVVTPPCLISVLSCWLTRKTVRIDGSDIFKGGNHCRSNLDKL